MKLIIMGAPGSGKGTQGALITEKYGIPSISTGDILRKNIKDGTSLGVEAKRYIDKGGLVPDNVMIGLMAARLAEPDCKNGYLLDGFPRTAAQADALGKLTNIDKALNIDVPLAKLMARLTGRRVCGECGLSYHISTHKGASCAKCGGLLITRPDDNEEAVKTRLTAYTEKTAPLIEYYSAKKLLAGINGDRDIDKVFADIVKVIEA